MTDVSDHLPVFISIDKYINKNSKTSKGIKRDFSKRNIQHFNQDLNDVCWEELLASDNVDEAYENSLNCVLHLYDKDFPQCVRQSSINKSKSPWITEGIYNSIREKKQLYKKFIKNPTVQNKSIYVQFKNKLTSVIRMVKKNFLSKELDKDKFNIKGTWKLINSLLNKTKVKVNPSYYTQNETRIDSDVDIANAFNDYFTNIANRIAGGLPQSSSSFEDFLGERCAQSLFLTPVTKSDIVHIISKLPSGKAPGYDGLGTYVVKEADYALATPLTILINKSFVTGRFPSGLKIGKVVPIYKNGDKHDISNYRPITILSVFSKVFEKAVQKRLLNFINRHGLLSESQFGFRANRSTELAIVSVLNKIINAIENKQFTVGVFLDLSKAFDTVNHDILSNKLDHIGIRGVALDWFKSYLSNRKQFVAFNSTTSIHNTITCGVPQGSACTGTFIVYYIHK